MKAIIGRKIGMTQILTEDGESIGVTIIQAGPCVVANVRNEENDGYKAVALGFESDTKPAKPQAAQFKKLERVPKVVKEFRSDEELKIGDSINVDTFELGDTVTVRGVSKGKGFAGTIKRHNFNTGPKTHGSSSYRRPGSIGSMYPQNIMKGKKMAGQLGSAKTTVKNQSVALIDPKLNLIGIAGGVPGPRNSLVTIEVIS